MKLIKLLIVLYLFSFYTVYAAKVEIKFGLLYGKIFLSKKEALIGSNLWLKEMEKEYKNADISVKFYKEKDKLLKDFKDKKISAIISNGIFYYDNKKTIDKDTLDKWVLARSDNLFEQFYLIKNKKSDYTLDNLDAKSILYREEFANIWFKTLVDNKTNSVRKIAEKLHRVKKNKKLIFDVFFNKEKMAIVAKDLYDSMSDINPQIKEQIEIIKKSKAIFIRAMGFTRKDIDPKEIELLSKITARINISKTNFELISFLQVQNVFLIKDKELQELDEFYKNYKRQRF